MSFAAPLAYLNTSIPLRCHNKPLDAIGWQASLVWARELEQRSNYVAIASTSETSQELQASTKLELAQHGGLLPSQYLGVLLSVRP